MYVAQAANSEKWNNCSCYCTQLNVAEAIITV